MHLLIPFTSMLSEAAAHVLRDLRLPHLAGLLGRLVPTARDTGDEYSFSPPHERALADIWGWPASADGTLPFAARAAADDGIDVGGRAWALVTPAHWQLGRDTVTLADPAELDLANPAFQTEERALFEAVRDLFVSAGFAFARGAPERWYAAHESLAGLPTASLDRVIGRNVELWLRNGPAAPPQTRAVRRLQSEAQLLLYTHPVNEAREARGVLPLNSFWLSGCGRFEPSDGAAVEIDMRLRAPLLAADWAGWAGAWHALDAGPLAALAQAAGHAGDVRLTLCGERSWQRFERAPQTLWQRARGRWNAPEPHAVLEAL